VSEQTTETQAQNVQDSIEYSQEVEQAKKEGQKAKAKGAAPTGQPKIILDHNQEQFAKATLPLISSEAYRAFKDMKTQFISQILTNPYSAPPAHVFVPSNNGENLAFNCGRLHGLQEFERIVEGIWKIFLSNQEDKPKENTNE